MPAQRTSLAKSSLHTRYYQTPKRRSSSISSAPQVLTQTETLNPAGAIPSVLVVHSQDSAAGLVAKVGLVPTSISTTCFPTLRVVREAILSVALPAVGEAGRTPSSKKFWLERISRCRPIYPLWKRQRALRRPLRYILQCPAAPAPGVA